MTVLLLLLGCIVVADAAMRRPAAREARTRARQARKTTEALARASRRADAELLVGLGMIAVGVLVVIGR